MVFQRFYSYPPRECEWSWVLRNLKQKAQPTAAHEIVDVGILDLKKPPYRHTEEKIQKWEKIRTDGWKVVFDCLDLKGEFGITEHGFDTVEYSKQLIREFYNGESNLMPVIQGYSNNYQSFIEFADWLKRDYPAAAVIGVSGIIGRSSNRELVYRVLAYIRRAFPNSWIHVFALHKRNFDNVYNLFDSFDSMNWTRSPGPNGKSYMNRAEEIEFFWNYIQKLRLDHTEEEQEVLV